ncbi:hypothetical protein M3O57_11660 [Xanthomonas nasturtii]|uniref:Uncharacterized protein n=1 Tax=Xanthomonas nasturtii TaxID=1843581 RepID=A0ABT0LR44_9XANT|nr:hypothetical protein [Xanthomonas nasturtii]MCL1531847.1 hypothetical protein [Xanthomonas nasturtii]MCL1551811.1 hypothetical protein [Xanthomonas nasturtii]MCL1556132.1 hypothetical protein [Xanthomonas nasturtii]MCL1566535.1 hypothetical protein [Xanthomonas nasturtii]MCL1569818.1 hypothetical protein [Xanthomonas nasturtii]
MSKDAVKTLPSCTIAIAVVVASTALAEQTNPSDLWPLQRQQLLTGTYTGQLRPYTQGCLIVSAELFLSMPTPNRKCSAIG